MAGIVTNPMTQSMALGNQSSAAGAQMQQYQLMQGLLSHYLGQAMNPQNLASGAASMTQPLSGGQVENIQNQVGGNVAEQGLAQSPRQWQSELGNALGGAQMGNMQTGLQNYLSGQQLPFSVSRGIGSVQMPGVPQSSGGLLGSAAGAGLGAAMGAML